MTGSGLDQTGINHAEFDYAQIGLITRVTISTEIDAQINVVHFIQPFNINIPGICSYALQRYLGFFTK